MSTKEMVHSMIDRMSEEQVKALFVVLSGTVQEEKLEKNISDEVDALCGIFHDAADPALVPFEKEAWAEAAAEEERRFWEDYNNEDA